MVRNFPAFTLAFFSVFLLSTCEVWGPLDNPTDPKSRNYPGYDTIPNVDDIVATIPPDKGTLSGAFLSATKIVGATAYELRIATSVTALDSAPLFSKSDYTINVMDISSSGIQDRTTYWWKVRATAGGKIGVWSTAANFVMRFQPAATPTFTPAGGFYASSQNVTIACATPGTNIFFTTDGSEPTTASTNYSGQIVVSVNPGTTVRAIAMAPLSLTSSVGIATYQKIYLVGDPGPASGLVFYDKGSISNGWRYLEAAPYDQTGGARWYNGSNVRTDASGTSIGTGAENTIKIVASQGDGFYAAKICTDLVLGGYADWFLPSRDELNQMYISLAKQNQGNFRVETNKYYWSSSEGSPQDGVFKGAWLQRFFDGNQGNNGTDWKSGSLVVR
ncbi:MAG: chitobiase/beta-hexosaminidase C-terminal domain-containing protein, partial [Spirochaetota bacterium]